jgi:cytochrome c biogenesis protein ResB
MVYLRPGETGRIPFAGQDSLDVILEEFDMEYVWMHERYFPRDYKSTVSLSTGQRQVVEVNRPLKHHGLTIYQMDYQQKFDLLVADTAITVTAREPFAIPGLEGLFRTGTVYLGTLFRDDQASPIVPNAKLYQVGESGGPPMMGRGEEIGELVSGQPFEYQEAVMLMQDAAPVSGLFYRKDTGFPVVFYALILFMAGLFLRIFFPGYRLRVHVDQARGLISVSGRAYGMTADLEKITERLNIALVPQEGEDPGA